MRIIKRMVSETDSGGSFEAGTSLHMSEHSLRDQQDRAHASRLEAEAGQIEAEAASMRAKAAKLRADAAGIRADLEGRQLTRPVSE
ncbi:hypothetical protein HBI65_057250 [Parastagonospora nodorum]|nr:hypothetical protein HBI65_057250 [Parastagonospora nodorum]